MTTQPATFDPEIAHITAGDGTVFQVLLDDGSDWDEAATAAAYRAYLISKGLPQ